VPFLRRAQERRRLRSRPDRPARTRRSLSRLVRLAAALTIHTDFSDTRSTAIGQPHALLALSSREARLVFLQDAGIFQFADLGNDLIPFFSRRIGLDDQRKESRSWSEAS